MGAQTGISWTDHTFNVAWGCVKVSPGCKHCYAETLSSRYGKKVWGPNARRRTLSQQYWKQPIAWNQAAETAGVRRRVFCGSMCDIGKDHTTIIEEVVKLWPLIRKTPWLDWQLLTKRPERYPIILPPDWGYGYQNVWLGTSVENNDYVGRVDHLRKIEAVVRFISYEPALGPLDQLNLTGIDWIIYGGESGPHFREHDVNWARQMRDRCRDAGIAFFYKQSSSFYSGRGITLDGVVHHNFPLPRLSDLR